MTGHTPGPWIVGTTTNDPFYVTSNTGIVAQALVGYAADRSIGSANARLIAAAPDLLVVLERIRVLASEAALMPSYMLGDVLGRIDDLARAAIGRATSSQGSERE